MIVWKIDKNEIKYIPQNLQDKKQQNIFLDKYVLVSYHNYIVKLMKVYLDVDMNALKN